MIDNLYVAGYKCLKGENFKFSNLNILVGPNASGKSTVLQSLLLLRQSYQPEEGIERMLLSGSLYEGGLATDVLHPEAEQSITIEIQEKSQSSKYHFYHDRGSENGESHRFLERTNKEKDHYLHSIFSDQFIYLNAERVAPSVSYSLPSEKVELAGLLGKHGEYTSSVLSDAASTVRIVPNWDNSEKKIYELIGQAAIELEGIDIHDDLVHSDGRLDLVVNQVLGWIIPGAKFFAEKNNDTDSSTLKFIRDPNRTSTPVRATHIGFGLTYLLPIITAALMLDEESLLIIENPEAHLHPYSQSRIGVFLAIISSLGKQVFIETHSDHVVNGIRLAISKGYLENHKLKTHFFNKPIHGTTASVTPIECSSQGRLNKWPDGFFDQIESDLSKL